MIREPWESGRDNTWDGGLKDLDAMADNDRIFDDKALQRSGHPGTGHDLARRSQRHGRHIKTTTTSSHGAGCTIFTPSRTVMRPCRSGIRIER